MAILDEETKKQVKKDLKPKKFFADFKKFIFSGNFGEIVTGLVIVTAFTTLIRSLINDVAMPVVSFLLGDVNFSDFKFELSPPTAALPQGIYIDYGVFIQNLIDFVILALLFFIMVKIWTFFHKKKEAEAQIESEELQLLKNISKRIDALEKTQKKQRKYKK